MEARKLSKLQPPPFELALRIRHPSMDPAYLSRALGLEATHSFRAGEPRRSRSYVSSASVHGESYWLATLDPSTWPAANWLSGFASLELAHRELGKSATVSLGWALLLSATRLLRTNAALLQRIRVEGGQVSLLVALSPVAVDSFSLTPEVSRIFSELGIAIEFEIASE
ncbi:MAG: hypothetical protein ACLP2F_01320 [Steroidobacteraceae bacterium]